MTTAPNGLPVDEAWLAGIRSAARELRELLAEMYATPPSETFDAGRCVAAVAGLEDQAVNWVASAARHARIMQPADPFQDLANPGPPVPPGEPEGGGSAIG